MRVMGAGILSLAVAFGALSLGSVAHAREAGLTATQELSAQQRRTRTRITVYPQRQALGPNSVRQCRTRLTQEYRPSGTVIFPRMYCWWE
jgi:hypothetical protein